MRLASPSTVDLTARRVTAQLGRARGDTLRHLSTGLRVSLGRDDPAALIAGEVLRQDRTRAEQIGDAAGLAAAAAAVGESTLAGVNDDLLELRALLSGSYGNTLTRAERLANQRQADDLIAEIDRALTRAEYKGRPLFRPPPADTGVDRLKFAAAGDIGTPATPGSHVDVTPTNGHAAYQITGSSSNWGSFDSHYFMRNTVTGDGVMEAAVDDFVNPHSIFGRGGIMWRQSDDPRSPYVGVLRYDHGHVSLIHRDTYNGPTSTTGYADTSDADPTYFRLARVGDTFTGEWSADGVSYTPIGARTVPMTADARLGIYFNSNAFPAATNTIRDVRYAPGNVPPSLVPPPVLDVPRPDAGTLAGDPATVEQTALVFDLGTGGPGSLAALRLEEVSTRTLGTPAAKLDELRSGGDLALTDVEHPDDAARVVEAAIKQVSTLRGRLGNFERNLTRPAARQGDTLAAELADANSTATDTRFAESTAELARLDVLRRSTADVLAVSFDQQRRALDLLG